MTGWKALAGGVAYAELLVAGIYSALIMVYSNGLVRAWQWRKVGAEIAATAMHRANR